MWVTPLPQLLFFSIDSKIFLFHWKLTHGVWQMWEGKKRICSEPQQPACGVPWHSWLRSPALKAMTGSTLPPEQGSEIKESDLKSSSHPVIYGATSSPILGFDFTHALGASAFPNEYTLISLYIFRSTYHPLTLWPLRRWIQEKEIGCPCLFTISCEIFCSNNKKRYFCWMSKIPSEYTSHI